MDRTNLRAREIVTNSILRLTGDKVTDDTLLRDISWKQPHPVVYVDGQGFIEVVMDVEEELEVYFSKEDADLICDSETVGDTLKYIELAMPRSTMPD